MRRIAGVLILIGSSALVPAQGLLNGNFDQPGIASSHVTVEEPGWMPGWRTRPGVEGAFSGTVAYLNDATAREVGGRWVQLGYYFGQNGIEQTVATVPGREYLLTFWIATDPFNGPPARLRVAVDQTQMDLTAPPRTGDFQNLGWRSDQVRFTAGPSGNSTVTFLALEGIPAVDGVTLTAVPEPSLLSLLVLGGLVIRCAAKRF